MAYKSLLSIVTSAASADSTITAASAICLANDAHLDVLALGVDHTQVGYSYVGSGAVMLQVALERAEADARVQETAVRRALDAQPAGLRWGVEAAVVQIGALTDLVASRARFSDLVVLARPYGAGVGSEAEAVVEAVLFEAHVPVLVLPAQKPGAEDRPSTPRRVVIAWNQSAGALQAVRKAMPFLKAAEMVNIVVIDPPTHGAERSDPGGMLCQMLVRHGVRAEVSVLAKTMPRVSEVLARHVRDQNADLLVMGAYGHSRFREAILGGATRNMLEQADVPVLMAH